MKSAGALELEQGKNMIEAAREAKLGFVVASVIENVDKASSGRINVPHFTVKAEIGDLWRKSGIPTSFALPGTFARRFVV